MKKLLKQHGLNSDIQYYEMIRDNYVNGNITDSYGMFMYMPKSNRVKFVDSLLFYWFCTPENMQKYFFRALTGTLL